MRTAVRAVHIGLAVAVGTYVYLPPALSTGLRDVLMVVVFPLVVLSGGYLWQQARIHRVLARR